MQIIKNKEYLKDPDTKWETLLNEKRAELIATDSWARKHDIGLEIKQIKKDLVEMGIYHYYTADKVVTERGKA